MRISAPLRTGAVGPRGRGFGRRSWTVVRGGGFRLRGARGSADHRPDLGPAAGSARPGPRGGCGPGKLSGRKGQGNCRGLRHQAACQADFGVGPQGRVRVQPLVDGRDVIQIEAELAGDLGQALLVRNDVPAGAGIGYASGLEL